MKVDGLWFQRHLCSSSTFAISEGYSARVGFTTHYRTTCTSARSDGKIAISGWPSLSLLSPHHHHHHNQPNLTPCPHTPLLHTPGPHSTTNKSSKSGLLCCNQSQAAPASSHAVRAAERPAIRRAPADSSHSFTVHGIKSETLRNRHIKRTVPVDARCKDHPPLPPTSMLRDSNATRASCVSF